jgi:hypothetical protein
MYIGWMKLPIINDWVNEMSQLGLKRSFLDVSVDCELLYVHVVPRKHLIGETSV